MFEKELHDWSHQVDPKDEASRRLIAYQPGKATEATMATETSENKLTCHFVCSSQQVPMPSSVSKQFSSAI